MKKFDFKVGQKVKTRKGEIGTVVWVKDKQQTSYPIIIGLDTTNDLKEYTADGTYYIGENSSNDIVEIIEEENVKKPHSFPLPENFYIPIHSPEHSAAVQQWLFDNDVAMWESYGKNVMFINEGNQFLYIRNGMCWRGTEHIVQCDAMPETKIEFKSTLTVEPIIPKQTFSFLGEEYVVEDIEKLKKALEEVGVVKKV